MSTVQPPSECFCDAANVQLQAESVPVFMMEPAALLPGTPLVAKDFDAAADQITTIPAVVSPTAVGVLSITGVSFCFLFVSCYFE